MGKINSKIIEGLTISPQWKFEAANAKTRIFKNQKGQIAEQFFVNIQSNDNIEKIMHIYSIRKKQSQTIAQIYGVQMIGENAYFCSPSMKLRVLVQYLPKTLKNISSMTTEVVAYTLFQVLKGFKQIFVNFGRIKVHDKLIYVSNEGFVKIWINSNLALNYPEQLYQGNAVSKQDQIKMVWQILAVIKPYCKGENYPLALINYFNKVNILDFDSAILSLNRYIEDVQQKRPQFKKDGSIINKLFSNNSQAKKSFTSQNKIMNQYQRYYESPEHPQIKKVTSNTSFFTDLSNQINQRIKDNTENDSKNNKKQQKVPELKRFSSIPNIRKYNGN